MEKFERLATVALAGLTLAPLVLNVHPHLNAVLTACLTVFLGCCHSVKPTPPSETLSNGQAISAPCVASAMMLFLFCLFESLPKNLVNAVFTCNFFIRGIIDFKATLVPAVRLFIPKSWNQDFIIWHIPSIDAPEVELSLLRISATILSTLFCAWYASKKHWLANNVLGLASSIQLIEKLSLGSFETGAIFLAGFLVYDIFWVFFSSVMVSLTTSFDAPIKLLFPTAEPWRPYAMLGLGDLVNPGIFVALALRFDVSRGKKSQYFKSAFLGYATGLIITVIASNWFETAQPALLYIVPAVIGFLAVHVIWNGELKLLLEFDESKKSSSYVVVEKDSKKDE